MALPGGPLREVASVTVDGKPVTDWRLLDGRLWRPYGWGGAHVPIEGTYTHGYDPVPADIVRMVCMFVSAGLHAAEDGFGEIGSASWRELAQWLREGEGGQGRE